ncbi:MAG TPA: hypothetical protein VHY91_17350 [Pirellulales bacterium]|jgi:hypothetical protein|nr:hypothetical protein [Pirellulales bacterium]
MAHTTPAEITDQIKAFCRILNADDEPSFVPVVPVRNARVDDCYFNVGIAEKAGGGEPLHGWTIWIFQNDEEPLFLDAEHHSVWRKPDRKLVDVSPRPDGETQILFHPDPERVYQGSAIPSQFFALKDDPTLAKYLQLLPWFNRLRMGTEPIDPTISDWQRLQLSQTRMNRLINLARALGLPVHEYDG